MPTDRKTADEPSDEEIDAILQSELASIPKDDQFDDVALAKAERQRQLAEMRKARNISSPSSPSPPPPSSPKPEPVAKTFAATPVGSGWADFGVNLTRGSILVVGLAMGIFGAMYADSAANRELEVDRFGNVDDEARMDQEADVAAGIRWSLLGTSLMGSALIASGVFGKGEAALRGASFLAGFMVLFAGPDVILLF